MRRYRVFLRGRDFILNVEDERQRLGFHTTRFVEADNPGLYRLLQERDRALAQAFNDLRRSTALRRLAAWVELGLLTEEELGGFSPDVRQSAAALRKR